VIFVSAVFGRCVAFALFGDDVDQHRAFRCVAHIFQHRQQVIEIVPVNRADIVKAQLFEQSPARHQTAGKFLCLADGVVHPAAHLLDHAGSQAAEAEIFG